MDNTGKHKRHISTWFALGWWWITGNTTQYLRLRMKELLPLIAECYGDEQAQRLADADNQAMKGL